MHLTIYSYSYVHTYVNNYVARYRVVITEIFYAYVPMHGWVHSYCSLISWSSHEEMISEH